MARIARLPDTLYEYDFVKLARQESHACTRERLLGMAHLQKHGSLTRTAQALFVHITTVQKWLNRFRQAGVAGLQEKPRSGRPSRLSKEQVEALPDLIQELSDKRSGGRIKGQEIRGEIAQRYGVDYHLNSVYFLLHRQGWSWVSARSKHPKHDEQAQEGFKKL